MKRVYLKDVLIELGYKTRRSVIKWCLNNGIGILSDHGSNKKYVIEEEFEAAKLSESIKHIRQKYGTGKLPEVFNSIMNIHTELMSALEERDKGKANTKTNYVPAGQHETKFLATLIRLTQNNTEL